jgi:hypothetical protein
MAHSSLRFGIGRFTTEAEVDFVVEHIVRTVHKLREMRFEFYHQVSFLYADLFASQPTMGDGSGRNRYQLYRLVSALVSYFLSSLGTKYHIHTDIYLFCDSDFHLHLFCLPN